MTDQHLARRYLTHLNYRQRQGGLSMISLMLVAGVAMFFLIAAFKVGPSYAEYWTISRIADNVAAQSELLRGPKSGVYSKLAVDFRQNNLWDAKPKDHIHVVKDGKKGTMLKVDYESRNKLFGNIYVVTKFNRDVVSQ